MLRIGRGRKKTRQQAAVGTGSEYEQQRAVSVKEPDQRADRAAPGRDRRKKGQRAALATSLIAIVLSLGSFYLGVHTASGWLFPWQAGERETVALAYVRGIHGSSMREVQKALVHVSDGSPAQEYAQILQRQWRGYEMTGETGSLPKQTISAKNGEISACDPEATCRVYSRFVFDDDNLIRSYVIDGDPLAARMMLAEQSAGVEDFVAVTFMGALIYPYPDGETMQMVLKIENRQTGGMDVLKGDWSYVDSQNRPLPVEVSARDRFEQGQRAFVFVRTSAGPGGWLHMSFDRDIPDTPEPEDLWLQVG